MFITLNIFIVKKILKKIIHTRMLYGVEILKYKMILSNLHGVKKL